MNLLEEADLCIIEANYLDVLSDLEKTLLSELRAARKRANENEAAADQLVELRYEVEALKERIEDAESEAKCAQDERDAAIRKADELRAELDALEDKLARAKELFA